MTTEELLKPRYKLIADYPYTDFNIGDILCLDNINEPGYWSYSYAVHDGIERETEAFFQDYPHLFKRLKWWQERTINDLESIKFVKVKKYVGYWLVGDIVEVKEFIYKQNEPIQFKLTNHPHPIYCVEPATEQEYNEYKTKS